MENKSEISAENSKRNNFVLFKMQIFISLINTRTNLIIIDLYFTEIISHSHIIGC